MLEIRFKCSSCNQQLDAPGEAAGNPVQCPNCQEPLVVPCVASAPAAKSAPNAFCGFCQTGIAEDGTKTNCPVCQAPYHEDCWSENGGCAIYGCSQVPQIEQRRAIEIPISYWGQENKPCPACGFQILAAAVRCRNCGATFSSARPENSDEFRARAELDERVPTLKRNVVILFVLSALPCTAPIAAVIGLIWFFNHRHELNALPAIFPALSKIGLGLAIAQCVLFAGMVALYAFTQTY